MTTHPDTPEPTPERTAMTDERSQIDILADYLMEHHADAITGGGAGDVAIRLIQALCDEIERLKSITFEHPCVCDLYGDADANYISRITRLRETNRTLGETNERLRAVIAERDAEIARLEIDNSRLCEELNTIEIEVPDVE